MYRGALAVSCLFISHTCVCIYMCILFAHRDQKCYQRNAACLMSFHYTVQYIILESGARARVSPPSQTNQTDWSHHTCLLLYISEISSRLVCLVCLHTKGRRRSSQCLKHTLLLASMTNLFTTVVMCFHEYKYSFDFCNLLLFLAILKEKNAFFLFCFFYSFLHQGIFQMTNVAGS